MPRLFYDKICLKNSRGVTLIEILISIVLIVIASVAAFGAFSYGKGHIVRQGNARAAYEQTRGRLDQLMAAKIGDIKPIDGSLYWIAPSFGTPPWTLTLGSAAPPADNVSVNGVTRPIRTTVQWIDDPSAGTGTTVLDVLVFSAKVWYEPGNTDDNFNRAEIRTLRPSSG